MNAWPPAGAVWGEIMGSVSGTALREEVHHYVWVLRASSLPRFLLALSAPHVDDNGGQPASCSSCHVISSALIDSSSLEL